MPKSGCDVSVTVTLATLVAVLLISNILLFIMGCVCGHYLWQKCRKLVKRDSETIPAHKQSKTINTDEQEVELEQNVAYGHFRWEIVFIQLKIIIVILCETWSSDCDCVVHTIYYTYNNKTDI